MEYKTQPISSLYRDLFVFFFLEYVSFFCENNNDALLIDHV